MKRYFAFPFGILVCCMFFFGQPQSAAFRGGSGPKARFQPDSDRQLADAITKVTDRSADGLARKRLRGGGVAIDFDGPVQKAMLIRMGDGGEAEAACVGGLGEASAFFGRDLETGAALPRTEFPKPDRSSIEREYGMSVEEFNFYNDLIRDAEARRALNPELATFTIQNAD